MKGGTTRSDGRCTRWFRVGAVCTRTTAVLVIASALLGPPSASHAEDVREPTVGMAGRIEQIVIPGSELEPVVDDARNAPVVIRIVEVFPHGDALRYDLEFYGLEAGEFDLRDFLRRQDGSSMDDVPPMPVRVRSGLEPGMVRPHEPEGGPLARLGGYRLLLVAIGVGWVAGLAALVFTGRRKASGAAAEAAREPTFADRLRPLVEQASAGTLPLEGQAELERLVLRFWRGRLGLADLPAAEAWRRLRDHQQAGPLVQKLETWLHRPGGSIDPSELGGLLEPYTRDAAHLGDPVPPASSAPPPGNTGRKEVRP